MVIPRFTIGRWTATQADKELKDNAQRTIPDGLSKSPEGAHENGRAETRVEHADALMQYTSRT